MVSRLGALLALSASMLACETTVLVEERDSGQPDGRAPDAAPSDGRAQDVTPRSDSEPPADASDATVDANVDDDNMPPDAGTDVTADVPVDTSTDAGCLTWALGGIGVPTGTVGTASATYSTDVASNAIDGNLATDWNAPSNMASLTLAFPKPQAITGIRMATTSSPATMEAYTVTPSGSSTSIGSATEMVNGNPTPTIEPVISVTPGKYAGITISVNGEASWVVINEVSLVTTDCP